MDIKTKMILDFFGKDVKVIKKLMPPKRDKNYAYRMGLDCGKNGANAINCHFSIFSTPGNTKEWEQGKRNAKE